ncbi:MAG: carboxylating nicotinate-nucleotide diphosphorylase [Bacteroidales bacterium]|nr:carboxylating nicotinate-nucleotide diphosphorylase [Bacteroidales bacterium]
MTNRELDFFIENALKEDLGDGDHTSLACIPEEAKGKAQLLVKEKGVLAGASIGPLVFSKLDHEMSFTLLIDDGSDILPGDVVFIVGGSILALLQAERTVLNIMQRMSGIATTTRLYAERLKGLKTKILDTRKTTPGMRMLEKEAVRIGGGVNHRMGLYDMMLIKDNHIDFAGGIRKAIERSRQYLQRTGKDLAIEIEARSLEDVKTILDTGGVDRILLDNFSIDDTRAAVRMIGNLVETESSGGITLETIRSYAECGVDYISVGALTHHIDSLDLSLDAIDF